MRKSEKTYLNPFFMKSGIPYPKVVSTTNQNFSIFKEKNANFNVRKFCASLWLENQLENQSVVNIQNDFMTEMS